MAAVRLREVPRRRRLALHLHAVGGRGDGDRADVQAGVREGHALARARRVAAACPRTPRSCSRALETPSHNRYEQPLRGRPPRRRPRRSCARAPRSTPGSWPRWRRSRGARTPRPACSAASRRSTPAPPSSRPATPYFYSGWERQADPRGGARRRPSVVILGSGPNRIGQGIEFDYCCVHAAMTVRESGRDAVMVNCNPETVSTDYDTSDRLYFEPLTLEDVLGVIEIEQPEGVIVQFGGQTPLKLAQGLADAGVPLLGTPVESIHLAEDRPSFGALLDDLGLKGPSVRHRLVARGGAGGRRRGRLPAARAAVVRARRPGDGDLLLPRGTGRLPRAPQRRPPTAIRRSSSTASWRTRSRSTWTRSATARRCGSGRSCSTSRRPACTPATRPA